LVRLTALPARVGLHYGEAEGLELVYEASKPKGVVEERLVVGELILGEIGVHRFAVDLATPLEVWAVQAGRIGVARAVGLPAAIRAHRHRSGEDEADLR